MNAKYCVQQLLREELETPPGKALLAAGSLRQIWYVLSSIAVF